MSILLVILLAVIAEVFVIVQVSHLVGVLTTLILLVLLSASGPWLVRRTGLGVWRRAQNRLAAGEVPGREIVDGVLLLAAGILLTVPGFLTAVLGLALLLPPIRSLVRRWGAGWLGRRATVRMLSVDPRPGPGDGAIPARWRPAGGRTDQTGAAALNRPPADDRDRDQPGPTRSMGH